VELEAANSKGNSRQLFQVVKSLTRKFQPRLKCIQSVTGKNFTEVAQLADIWKEYCEDLYHDEKGKGIEQEYWEQEPPPLYSEFACTICQTASRKATGPDEVPVVMNLRYADDIILLATSESELQELVDRLDRVSRKYSLLINVDKTKVIASDGIACHILIQNEQLEQVDTFPYFGSLTTEDGGCTTEFHTRLNRGRRLGHHFREYGKVTA